MEYLFILGRTKELSVLELEKVLELKNIAFQVLSSSDRTVLVNTHLDLDADKLLNILAGTVKIARVFQKIESQTLPINEITSLLSEKKSRIIFGLSWYGDDNSVNHFNDLNYWSKDIKNKLEKEGFSVRYVLPKDSNELSSVVVEKQKLCEIIIFQTKNQTVIAETIGVQNFEDWNKRDYQRPVVAPDKGMLPPKAARMMVNIGRGELGVRSEKVTLLDPFCGTGTILAEALSMGLNVIGSDISKEAIDMVKKNLTWLCLTYSLPPSFKLYQFDASHISETLEKNTIDLIVTEPYLGPLIESDNRKPAFVKTSAGRQITENKATKTKSGTIITPGYIERIIDGLERMYQGCLKDWQKVLKENGKVVIILPSYSFQSKEYFVKKVVDNCEKLGYSIEVGPLPYSRPQAIVKRNIYVFKKV